MAEVEGSKNIGDILDAVPTVPDDSHLQELDNEFPGAAAAGDAAREHALKQGATPWEARIRRGAAAAGFAISRAQLEPVDYQQPSEAYRV